MQTKLSIFCSKVIEAGWLAAAVAIPLFFNIYTARTFEPDKLTLMRSIVTVMILAWLVKFLEETAPSNGTIPFGQKVKNWLKQPMVLPSIVILLIYIISTIASLSPLVSLWGSYQRMQGSYTFISYMIIFALMASNMRTREQIDRFITTIIIASIPVALYGIIQRNGLDPLPWAGDVVQRVASTMGNAIFVASYLVMIVPLTISRFLQSMTAIVTKEDASWGHTVLAAVQIFALAVQVLCVLYSGSRGPQLGLLGAFALTGLLILLVLRQNDSDKSALKIEEIGLGILPVLIVVVLGILGYFIGQVISEDRTALISVISTGVGLVIFLGIAAYLAASKRGWRWLWISWPVLGLVAVVFLVLLNIREGPLQEFRKVPYLNRLSSVMNTEGGTGKVRVLIWEGSLNLISPHRPLGIEGEYTDSLNLIRPLVGYGPESMFNAFAYAYPIDLAHHEARGSSADRSHNETIDSIVMTGSIGFLAFYFLMISLFYYLVKWLGWVPDRSAFWRLLSLMITCGLIGVIIPIVVQGSIIMAAVGLPFGLFIGVFLFLCWQGVLKQPELRENTALTYSPLLLIGLVGAFVGHFLEVHFVFSIAATYTYFWAYMGLVVAMAKITAAEKQVQPVDQVEEIVSEIEQNEEKPRQVKTRRRRGKQRGKAVRAISKTMQASSITTASVSKQEGWENWISVQGLAMAIILIILTFDFVPVQFDISTGNYSIVWLFSVTYLVGIGLIFSELAIRANTWSRQVDWIRAIMFYGVTSFGYAGFYILLHSWQRNILTTGRVNEVVAAANALVNILGGYYIALFLLMFIIAFVLVQGRIRSLKLCQTSNLVIYFFFVAAAIAVIFFKNFNVVKADIYLKEGERYRNQKQWVQAILLHGGTAEVNRIVGSGQLPNEDITDGSVGIDSDEDFYYLMLALDYQLMAQDSKLDQQLRQRAWLEGERIAVKARDINKYNPDNTGNLGRYYFTLGQVLDKKYFDKAKEFFAKAIELAPQNVQYYNLLSQVHYVQGNFDEAIEWQETSAELDDRFAPTWSLLGDTQTAKGNAEEALNAHVNAIALDPKAFADGNFDTRLNFYISTKQKQPSQNETEKAIEETDELPDQGVDDQDPIDILVDTFANYDGVLLRKQPGFISWAIGHIYLRSNELEKANEYFQKALTEKYKVKPRSFIDLGHVYLQREDYAKAEAAYQQALNIKSDIPEVYSSLGFIYARTDRLNEAIEANLKVLESMPKDYHSLKNLALLYKDTDQIDQAVDYTKRAMEAAPDDNKNELNTFLQQLLEESQTNP